MILGLGGQLADLVEENRSAVSQRTVSTSPNRDRSVVFW
jgi:hypothetical protein